MSPQVVAATIAASVSFLTLIGTLAAQYFGRHATSRDIEKTLVQQREQLNRTIEEQREQLDRTLAEQRERLEITLAEQGRRVPSLLRQSLEDNGSSPSITIELLPGEIDDIENKC